MEYRGDSMPEQNANASNGAVAFHLRCEHGMIAFRSGMECSPYLTPKSGYKL